MKRIFQRALVALAMAAVPALAADGIAFITNMKGDIAVDGVRVGSGRVIRRLPVGQHTVSYSAPNCDPEDRSITVQRDETQLVSPVTLLCH